MDASLYSSRDRLLLFGFQIGDLMKQIAAASLILSAASFLLFTSSAGYACEGGNLELTNQLYEHMAFVNQTCNEAGSVEDSMNCLREEWGYTVQKMSGLPEDCQDMLKEFDTGE
jgi:hypothetical protein